ncbi:MAG: hypothetical protein LIP18_02330 [Planctomycetes bacterium]|nr:hypothetical protein [Planctomycetota bacterium]
MKPKPFIFFLSTTGMSIPDHAMEHAESRASESRQANVMPEYDHQAFLSQMIKVAADTPRRRRFWSRSVDSKMLRLNLHAGR